MGLFDRFSTLLRSNINDLISRAEDPEKMLNQILVDMRSQLAKAKQQVATAIADEKRLRDQADAEYQAGAGLGEARDARDPGRSRRSRQAGARAPGRAHVARPAARADVGSAPARDREAQELAPRPERQDRRGEAQEESARRPPASRAGAEAHRRDDVVAVREVGVRGVRADGRAHRDRTSASSRRRSRSTRSSPATRCAQRVQAAREGRRRRSASTCSCSRSSRRWACFLPAPPQNNGSSAPGQRDEETVHAEIEDTDSEKKGR